MPRIYRTPRSALATAVPSAPWCWATAALLALPSAALAQAALHSEAPPPAAGRASAAAVGASPTNRLGHDHVSPESIGRTDAEMALRYSHHLGGEWLDKAIQRCKEALGQPLPRGVAFGTYELLGDLLQRKMQSAKFRDVQEWRKQSAAAYMQGLELALSSEAGTNAAPPAEEGDERLQPGEPPGDDLTAWTERFKGDVAYLYEQLPFTGELEAVGRKVGLNPSVLEELAKRAGKNAPAPSSPLSSPAPELNPAPGSLHFSASQYEIDGKFGEVFMSSRKVPGEAVQGRFKVFVKGGRWLIQFIKTDEADKPVEKEWVGSNNGAEIIDLAVSMRTNLVRVLPPGTKLGAPEPAGSKPKLVPMRPLPVATVVSNTVPVTFWDRPLISHLWLMLASRCYFDSLATNRLTPVYSYTACVLGDPARTLQADWIWMAGSNSLPLRVVYYNGGGFYDMTTNLGAIFTAYQPPFSAGFTDAVYTVTGVTNVAGSSFPSGFIFEEFRPAGPTVYDLWVCKRAEATVTAVKTACDEGSFWPPIPEDTRTVVNDFRLVRAQPPTRLLTYLSPRGHWASVAEARRLARRQGGRSPLVRIVVVACCVLLAVPLVVATVRILQRRTGRRL